MPSPGPIAGDPIQILQILYTNTSPGLEVTSTSTREKIVTEVEKLLMTLGKIWTQFVLEKKYGCAQQSKYIWCQKKYVIVCIIYVCYEPIGI